MTKKEWALVILLLLVGSALAAILQEHREDRLVDKIEQRLRSQEKHVEE